MDHCFSHVVRESRSLCSFFLVLFVFNGVTAQGVISKQSDFSSMSMSRSLMYRRKRHGPTTDPGGLPSPQA